MRTATMDLGPDPNGWELWWKHNREAFLEVGPWNSNPISGLASDDPLRGGISRTVIRGKVVPALKHALEAEISPGYLRALLIASARVGDGGENDLGTSDLLAVFTEHLDAANVEVAETACIAIGILAFPKSLATLSALLHDTPEGRSLVGDDSVSTRLRSFAAYGIGLVGARTEKPDVQRLAAHALVQALDAREEARPDARAAAVIALGMIQGEETGKPASPQAETADTCACSSHDGLAQHILDLFDNERQDDHIRAHAPNTLARMTTRTSPEMRERIVETLLSAATRRSERELVRQGCIQALGHLIDADKDPEDVRVRKQLIKLSAKGRQSSRSLAVMALAEIATRRGTGHDIPAAGSREIQALLLRRLPRAKSQDEPWIALSLGVLARGVGERDPESAKLIGQALRDGLRRAKSPQKMTAYAIALGLCRDGESTDVLVRKLDKVDSETRALVAVAIGLAGEDAGIGALHERLYDLRHTPETLVPAAHSLALLRDTSVIDRFVELIEDCDCTLSQQGVALSLGRTRHPAALRPLLAQLESENEIEQTYAAIALGYLVEKESRPWSARVSTGLHYRAGPSTLTGSQGGILDLP